VSVSNDLACFDEGCQASKLARIDENALLSARCLAPQLGICDGSVCEFEI
jgi:hypothetical protein